MNLLRRVGLSLFAPVLAIVVALVISSVVMAALKVNPFEVFKVMVDFGSTPDQQVTAMVVIINRAIPLFISGLAVAIAFRMGLFNIGVEGQYRLAAIIAAAAGAAVNLPGPLHVALIIAIAMAVAALWAAIVAVLKVTRGVSEVISSIMLNYVALGLAGYLITGPFRGSAAGASIVATKPIPESGWLPGLNSIFGALGLANPPRQLYSFLIIAIILGVAVSILLNRTRFGFDLRASGLSPSAASASGVDARAMVVKTMLLSGAVAGLIGLPDLLGTTHQYTTDFTAGLGFLGIAVALLGRNKPVGIALAALLFAFLDRSSVPLQIASFPASVVTIIQGTIVLTVVVANEIARRIARRQAERLGAQVVAAVPGDGSTGGAQGPGGGLPPDGGPAGGTARPGAGHTDEPQGARA
jgi:simple sugar transport system permease protein